MKLIQDIRLFESALPNIDGQSLPGYAGTLYPFDDGDCRPMIDRLLILLRRGGFSLGGFHHLYLNFTPCLPHGEIAIAKRSVFREMNWLRYADVGCAPHIARSMDEGCRVVFVQDAIRRALLLFATPADVPLVEDCYAKVITHGADLLIPYKEKTVGQSALHILVRITDDARWIPVIRLYEADQRIGEVELPPYERSEFVLQMGAVSLAKRTVKIAPRRSIQASYCDLVTLIIPKEAF